MPQHNTQDVENIGQDIYDLACLLFPILRSITGRGVVQTLEHLREIIPSLQIHNVKSGTQVLDWVVPKEWNCDEAYITDPEGRKICDIAENNLHLVNYSVPVDRTMPLKELQEHLHSLPDQADAIPYVTSYYKERWGFCISEHDRQRLKDGEYHVVIKSTLQDGNLTYGEVLIPSTEPDEKSEIFVSTYVCHPSMGNNELSGPCVAAYLAQYVSALPQRRYNYRFIFVPETIGAIAYLDQHVDHLREHVRAGFNISCVGDDRCYSYLPSRNGETVSDSVATHVLEHLTADNFKRYSYLDRGSDERQYCSPGVDLPIATICRSKYGEYPEYHTSLDNLDLISPSGLGGAFEVYRLCFECLEQNKVYRATKLGEPQLGRYGLYQQSGEIELDARTVLNILAYADGVQDVLTIANTLDVPMWTLKPYINALLKAGLVEEV